jgi:hypothetical protein
MYTKAVLFICCLAVVTRLNQLDLGARLSKDQIPEGNTFECVATPSQTYPCVRLTIVGVRFVAGYDEKTRRIQYLSTQDRNFATKEGLHVGDWMRVREDELVAFEGWKIVGPKTESGWRIVVGYLGQQVRFSDGTTLDLSQVRHEAPRSGDVQILELEKGGV